MKHRLDQLLVIRQVVHSRSQAENLIRLGKVRVSGKIVMKPGLFVPKDVSIILENNETYVSRAGLKLASVARFLDIDFKDTVVLDVGSSTGGFTDYALKQGAKKVIAVDVGTQQLHPSLRGNKKIELHEKTDIREFSTEKVIDIVVIDVSFISLRMILPHIAKKIAQKQTVIVAMVKPQFEAGKDQVNKGIIKNEKIRRQILHDFEMWVKHYFVIQSKRDSGVSGAKGNQERFYVLMSSTSSAAADEIQ